MATVSGTATVSVALPSHDGRAEVATVVQLVRDLGRALGRPVDIHLGEASNIPRARNLCLRQAERARAASGAAIGAGARLWLLWVDSDIRFAPGAALALAAYMARAEREGCAVAAHYRQADGRATFFARRGLAVGSALTAADVARLPDWAAIGMAGFGVLYAPMEIGYVFHADEVGEDVHFWHDHPALELRFAKGVSVRHHKAVLL
jgi:hypothetical protein